ncbi:MAG: DUF2164 domain-containing protein [Alphaproteobacteria bacterium]|jgi:uncharacterized protein (DUF2164 family)|nr:MAG: DUF2164 domain-containing protein [Alphaproteobacteria bacterium]
MKIALSNENRIRAAAQIQRQFSIEFDERLSDFRADALIDLMLKALGPAIYNQGVQDARLHLQGKLDDLEGEVYADGDA